MNRKHMKSIIFIVEKVIFSKEGSDSDASASMFGEKPICLVHNTLESWTERLMAL